MDNLLYTESYLKTLSNSQLENLSMPTWQLGLVCKILNDRKEFIKNLKSINEEVSISEEVS